MKLHTDVGWVVEQDKSFKDILNISHKDKPGLIQIKSHDDRLLVEIWREPSELFGEELEGIISIPYTDLKSPEDK